MVFYDCGKPLIVKLAIAIIIHNQCVGDYSSIYNHFLKYH